MKQESGENDNARKMLNFIQSSPSCYQVVDNVQQKLREDGYILLKENEEWKICQGGKYYVNRNGSSLIAFHIPGQEIKGFHFIASHSDSPCFKIKEKPEIVVENQYVKLNVEKYGSMIMSTWLDRPLSVAGRVAVRGNEGSAANGDTGLSDCFIIKSVAVNRDLFVIPNAAIHMNPDINKGAVYNVQTDMLPLYGTAGNESFKKLIAHTAGAAQEDILGSDLYLYNREEGRIFGEKNEFICSPRLDNQECVYASLEAMLHTIPQNYMNVMIVFDNEEVGSTTRQGAGSTFLVDTLSRICGALAISESGYLRLLADSFMISADNAHGVHPNHPEKADPTNRPYLNGGIVIKYHGSQKYTTDGYSAAVIKKLCEEAGVPVQTYANHSNIAGGSTLGNISSAQVSVSTADIGLAQLAMHSAYETAGTKDVDYMIKAMTCFYNK